MAEQKKPLILVVGGMGSRNIPPWAGKAFQIEHLEQDSQRILSPSPTLIPDAVVCLSAWVSHKHYYDARSVSERHNVPLLVSPGGWSVAIRQASELGLDWFIRAIETAKLSDSEEELEPVQGVLDSAWRDAYERELSSRLLLERRYSKDRRKFEQAHARLQTAEKSQAAAERVLLEIRSAAQQQRAHLDVAMEEVRQTSEEIKLRSVRVTACLDQHFGSLRALLNYVDSSKELLLSTARNFAEMQIALHQSTSDLKDALDVASGAQPIAALGLTETPSNSGDERVDSELNDSAARVEDLQTWHG